MIMNINGYHLDVRECISFSVLDGKQKEENALPFLYYLQMQFSLIRFIS